jgi:hypothetical protein
VPALRSLRVNAADAQDVDDITETLHADKRPYRYSAPTASPAATVEATRGQPKRPRSQGERIGSASLVPSEPISAPRSVGEDATEAR